MSLKKIESEIDQIKKEFSSRQVENEDLKRQYKLIRQRWYDIEDFINFGTEKPQSSPAK